MVQGVFYRQNTKQQAELHNLCGWVKNLADGRVEALICGEEDQVQALEEWLQHGPPRAKVSDVAVQNADFDDTLAGFEVLR